MPSLADELAADQDPRVTCRLCRYLVTLEPKQRREWTDAIEDKTRFTHASIARAIERRGVAVGPDVVMNHRSRGHKP